ncbi:MAG: KpsF/GutQ family sugar-phosphate isomerase [Proteobacteria bacterium]|nr:KpsF/GutQ family sugar-phosphate isomerase [Pseudomonadota bacterium]
MSETKHTPQAPEDDKSFQDHARAVIELEAAAVSQLLARLNPDFDEACKILLNTQGRVVVVGMGKSGHIGGKIAATLASTGVPAFFVHPGEASHGDLGMITPEDSVIAISNSGETSEILTILPIIKRMKVKMIALTGGLDSSLARQADVTLDVSVEKEACPLNLAPTSSTTVTLVMGDALAIALYRSRDFSPEDFARSHPGGQLGRRLLMYVSDIMHSGDTIPIIKDSASLQDALLEMSSKGLGMTAIVNKNNEMIGIFTDGDLRRTLNNGVDIYKASITELMGKHPVTTYADRLAAETVQLMHEKQINGLFVVDDKQHVVGALNMHDLLKAGIV